MPWARFDDTFHSHPKITSLSDKAFRLYVNSITWSSQHLTDGAIPDHALTTLVPRSRPDRAQKWAQELVDCGLFVTDDTGFRIHDYCDYQMTKAQVEQRRKAGADRQAAFRNRRSGASSNGVTNESRNAVTDTLPAEETPSHPTKTPTGSDSNAVTPNRDLLFEAAYKATHQGQDYTPNVTMTGTERGKLNQAVAEIREVGATPQDVARFADRYRTEWPDMELTPSSLRSHWGRFSGEAGSSCTHRWKDGKTAWAQTTANGVDFLRCDKCRETK